MAKEKKIKPVLMKDSNDCWSGRVELMTSHGLYSVSFAAKPGEKANVAKALVRHELEDRVKEILSIDMNAKVCENFLG